MRGCWQSRINRYQRRLAALILTLLIINHLSAVLVSAQQWNTQWTTPQKIQDLSILQRQLVMVADQNQTVHAFNGQVVEGQSVIVYTQWTLTQGWTEPTDILLSPYIDDVQVMDVFLDHTGMLHLLFASGNEISAHIYYSNAPAAVAGNAWNWRKPDLIGNSAQSPFNAALTGDSYGRLYAIYSGNQDGNGVYALVSEDLGQSWSTPEPIFFSYADDLLPFGTRLFLGESGLLHAVWNVVNTSGHGTSGYYAQLNTTNLLWSSPSELDVAVGLGIRTPSVIEHEKQVLVTYYNGNENANWWRLSNDGGRTWSTPMRVSREHVGTNGHVSFVVDGQGALHIFFGQRTHNQTHGMWHSRWRDNNWTAAEPIVSGPMNSMPGAEFDPTFASAVISQGNTILLTWTTDAQVRVLDVWYSSTVLGDVPALPVVPLPVPTATPLPTTIPIPTQALASPSPTAVAEEEPLAEEPLAEVDSGPSPVDLVILSIAPSALLSMAVFVLYRLHRHTLR